MARRVLEYALIAGIMCLVPAVIWPEWVMPTTLWGGDAALTPMRRWEMRLFKGIVAPPAWIGSMLLRSESAYGCTAGVSWCRELYIPPPTVAAAEFFRVGFPFWLVTIGLVGESMVLLRQRLRSPGAAQQSVAADEAGARMEPRR
jgi:hypothetical protein